MKSVYRILVTPYNYDYWDVFTEDEALFREISQYGYTDEASEGLGIERYEELMDSYNSPKFPYILLGEHNLRQPD